MRPRRRLVGKPVSLTAGVKPRCSRRVATSRTRAVQRMPGAPRSPGRAAGQDIVRATLRAAELLLERDGIEALTTNTLARVAGVSIGSLYRYFPDKRAIVAELARELVNRAKAVAAEIVAAAHEADPRALLWQLTRVADHPSLGSLPLRRTLLREVPRRWVEDIVAEADANVEALASVYLASRPLRPGSADRMAFVLVHAVVGAVDGALLHEPARLREAEYRRELFRLMWSFVAPDGADLSPPTEPATPSASADSREEDAVISARLAEEPSHRRAGTDAARPHTRRGETTRKAVLASGAELLSREGFSALTVRRIAADAKLTPGALYRHFPSMEALVRELRVEHEAHVLRAAVDAFSLSRAHDGRRAIEQLVRVYASPERCDLALRRALLTEVPGRWAEEVTMATERAARADVARELERRGAELRSGDRDTMAFVACRAIDGVTQAALLRRDAATEKGALEAETTELVWRYLRGCKQSGG
jgi:AcrR family transcriptional regulator